MSPFHQLLCTGFSDSSDKSMTQCCIKVLLFPSSFDPFFLITAPTLSESGRQSSSVHSVSIPDLFPCLCIAWCMRITVRCHVERRGSFFILFYFFFSLHYVCFRLLFFVSSFSPPFISPDDWMWHEDNWICSGVSRNRLLSYSYERKAFYFSNNFVSFLFLFIRLSLHCECSFPFVKILASKWIIEHRQYERMSQFVWEGEHICWLFFLPLE